VNNSEIIAGVLRGKAEQNYIITTVTNQAIYDSSCYFVIISIIEKLSCLWNIITKQDCKIFFENQQLAVVII